MSHPLDQVTLAADDAVAGANAVRNRIHAIASDTHSAFRELEDSTTALESLPDHRDDQRRAELRAVRDRVAVMRQRIADSLLRVDQHSHQIEQSIAQQREHLDASATDTVHAQERLRAELEEHHHAVADQGARVSAVAGSFVEEVEGLLDQLRGQVIELHDRLAALDHDIVGRVTAVVQDLRHVGERTEHLSHDLAGRLRNLSSRFHDSAQRALIDDAIGALERSSHQLHESLDGLSRGAMSEMQRLDGQTNDLLRQLEGVIQVIDAIRPVLDMVQTVLG